MRSGRGRRWPRISALLLAGGTALVWSVRVPVARKVVDRRLAEASVPARYTIEQLGPWRQRLTNIVVGDPANPDLTADWIELTTRIGLDGARVTGIKAGRLGVRARLADGGLSLGSLDRLLPRGTKGGAFRLPAIDLDTKAITVALMTPAGAVQLVARGSGRLDGGFRGQASLSAPRLVQAGCAVDQLRSVLAIRVDRGAPELVGPVHADRVECADNRVTSPDLRLAARMSPDLTRWRGHAALATGMVIAPGIQAARTAAAATFAGTRAGSSGTVAATASRVIGPRRLAVRQLALDGRYAIGGAPRFAGQLSASGVMVPQSWRPAALRAVTRMRGTPVAPLADRLLRSAEAARSVNAVAQLSLDPRRLRIASLRAVAQGGARLLIDGPGVLLDRQSGTVAAQGVGILLGGGFPTVRASAVRRSDASIVGTATMQPYEADAAQLTLAPVRFALGSGGGTLATRATISGPLPDGRIDGLTAPLTLAWRGDALTIGAACTPVGVGRLAVGSLRMDRAALTLCPLGPALLRVAGGRVTAGARVAPTRLAGRIGPTPLSFATQGGTVSLAGPRFALAGVDVRLGGGAAPTRIAAASIKGSVADDAMAGSFTGGAGQIGAVPLILSGAEGRWRFANGALSLAGGLTVADAAAAPRFKPLHAADVALDLAGGTISAHGLLQAPGAVPVADVRLTHRLADGVGDAALVLAPLSFTGRFQPDALTPLTFGVVADVRGTVSGEARIGWSAAGTSSTGTFHTDALDLAAAFGPVKGIAGTLRFTNLLALESAPDQVATIASVNPGVDVSDGRVTYRLLAGGRVQVLAGHWPFAGGSLDLQPTTLDLSSTAERHLTFTLADVDAGLFLQQFNFNNLSASGRFDGTLPMIFGTAGGRIEGGHLRVRTGGNIAYLGDLTQRDLGFWGNLAFQSLRSIDYRDLAITLNGPLSGEMVTGVRFAGVSQGKGARSNFLIRRLQRLPLVFNIRIKAPFRGLVDSAQSFFDPSRLVARNLPVLLQQEGAQASPVQPPDSGSRLQERK